MPKKENRKGQKGIRIRNKVIVNVNTGRRPTNVRQVPRQPPSSGSFPKVMILQPQPQIQPQNLLQPQQQPQQVLELNRQLQSEREQSSQQIQNLENIVRSQNQNLEAINKKLAVQFENRSRGQQERRTPQPGFEKTSGSSSSSSSSSGRERQRESTVDAMNRLIREPTIPPLENPKQEKLI
jgi:hypothetical protein